MSDDTDCDDADASSNPGATEVCDLADNNCDGSVDEGVELTWFLDFDGDGEGDLNSSLDACSAPSGYVGNSDDCDDTNATINVSGTEVCDLADNNCDGNVDEGVESTFYLDSDGDGYGDASSTDDACSAPSGYVSDDSDCDDSDASSNPGATEICDGADNDCDGSVDEGVETTYYLDSDGDGEGDSASSSDACSAPSGYVGNSDDCDDGDSGINTSATEECDFVDNDCDGDVDDDDISLDLSTATEWYDDVDADGYGDDSAPTLIQCSQPSGYEATGGDCDDGDSATYPDAPESCDSVDNDCDGSVDENLFSNWYLDVDGDLYGAGSVVEVICNGSSSTLVDNEDDCDDSDFFVNPGVVEDYTNGIDDDCDGVID